MRKFDGTLLLSASDLTKFMGCEHATRLDLLRLEGNGPEPRADTDDAELLQKYGHEHEEAYLQKLQEDGRSVVKITESDLRVAARSTIDAILAGADIVYQGALLHGRWGGWADFIERVETPSKLGDFSYEVVDTKLKRKADPKHVLQLVLYSDLLAEIQGIAPEYAHVELGNGERASLRLADYSNYARGARACLQAFIDNPGETRPIPCADCSLCRWADHCEDTWHQDDSLFQVANITRTQVKKLEAEGIRTLADLAALEGSLRGIPELTLSKLVAQARLQDARKTGAPQFELRPETPGKGFDLLPKPQDGDMFYDIEGDPHYPDGLEYLHGVWFQDQFKAFWAHDHDAEKQALIDLFAFFEQQLSTYPQARIYHYAPYEKTALRRLAKKYGVGEAFLDRLLREGRLVDLYAVVRGAVICSESNYSIKSMEVFYDIKRVGEVTTGGGSVVAYEEWRDTREQSILDEIEDYNRIDCVSTELLRDWLVSIRPERDWPDLTEDARETQEHEEAEVAELRSMLEGASLSDEKRDVLFNLAMFHKREQKPAWWAIFDSLAKDQDDLLDDLDALAGLTATGQAWPIKRSIARTYRYPPQETKISGGKSVSIGTADGGFTSINIHDMDEENCLITLKKGSANADVLRDDVNLHPSGPLDTAQIEAAVKDVVRDQCDKKNYKAVNDLLDRASPRLEGITGLLAPGDDLVVETVRAVKSMQETVLPIQGPPGTGKTFVTARAILALVKDGFRVGVASNSHEAIKNVLDGCEEAAKQSEDPLEFSILHKASDTQVSYSQESKIQRTPSNDVAAASGDVVGGTAFFFSRDDNIQNFDWLFVDEAGQVGLANMVGMGRAAKNIVLVGDPQQLPQVIQGSHPYPANLSCLEWMLGGQPTIDPTKGIFLSTTRRMHPRVNKFISEQMYEGRLQSHEDNQNLEILNSNFPANGAYWVSVSHEGNSQVAEEEVAAIRTACLDLLQAEWRDKDGKTRSITASDILVVAPYNAQVNALKSAMPKGVRVGTVDKFQGQEAAVCIVSMTASSAEESPKGLEFLYSLNRNNVAVSRAKALALVFGAPKLREAKCSNVEQMRMVNALCALEPLPVAT